MAWDHKLTNTQRGYGAKWRKMRAIVMQRDMNLCQPCLRAGRTTPAREVDHKTPKAKGGDDSLHNLQAICIPCHKAKTQREATGGDLKEKVVYDREGKVVW